MADPARVLPLPEPFHTAADIALAMPGRSRRWIYGNLTASQLRARVA